MILKEKYIILYSDKFFPQLIMLLYFCIAHVTGGYVE